MEPVRLLIARKNCELNDVHIQMIETLPVILCGYESGPVMISDEERQRVTEVIFLWTLFFD